jgi:hypothetical protein
MSKYLLLLLSFGIFFTTHSFSQSKVRGSVKGVLIDSLGGRQPLANATISVRPLGADSTEAEYKVSDKKGAFQFTGLTAGQYYLLITYEGYAPISRNFSVGDSNVNVDLSTLYIQRADKMLAEVIVQRPPMQAKKDTFEYNAGSFAVKPNAVAEDLLKKMPGMTVGKDGTVSHAGETVARVMVDGKRFFSDDPKLATRNLPPDIIDKIQVFDDLSDQSKFTGFDDGNRVKTINIITKKNTRKGYFGKAVAGDGSNEDYDASINFHRFDGDQQISLLGQANNLNKQNFTPQDIFGNGGGGGGRGGGGGGGRGGGGGAQAGTSQSSTGITTIWAGGANFRNSFGPKTDFYGSYFYNNQHVSVNTQDSSVNPITSKTADDSSNVSNSRGQAYSRIENHRIYLNLEQRFDSSNSLIFRPNITFQKSTPSGTSSTAKYDQNFSPIYNLNGQTSSENSGFNINSTNLQFRHKFKKPARTISLDMNATANINNGTGLNYSQNTFYHTSIGDSATVLNQFYNDSLHSVTLTPTLAYTEPIAKNMILQLNYNHTYTKSTSVNNTYDFSDSTKGFTGFDSLFSNSYKFVSNSDQLALFWRLQNKKYNLSVGSGVQWTTFKSDNTTKDIKVSHQYVTVNPTVNFQYTLSSSQHLRFFYNGRTGTPTPNQLQPLTTTTDNINFQVGNPGLKPQFTHSIRMLYTSFDPGTQHVFFATINASTIVNDIQSATYRTDRGKQYSSYVNLNGTYNISGYFNYGMPLKTPKSNLNFSTGVNYTQSQSLQAADSVSASQGQYAHLYVKNTSLSETITWTTNIKKNFDMNFSSSSQYTIPTTTGLPGGTGAKGDVNANTSLNSFTETLGAEFTAYTNNGWLIAATFDYIYTYNHSNTFNTSVPLLTPSIAKQLFKKKNGELRLSVFDILDKNTSATKSVGGDGTVDYKRSNVLSRYAMLTFTYNLNNFAGSNQRRMPGVFPGRFRGGGGGGRGGGGFGGPGGLYNIY